MAAQRPQSHLVREEGNSGVPPFNPETSCPILQKLLNTTRGIPDRGISRQLEVQQCGRIPSSQERSSAEGDGRGVWPQVGQSGLTPLSLYNACRIVDHPEWK